MISLIERESLKGKVKTGLRTSSQKDMKTLTLIRLEDGTLIDKREHGRRPPSTPDEAEVQHFLITESSPHFSITEAIEARLSDHRTFTTTSGLFGHGR